MALSSATFYQDLLASRASGGFPFGGINYDRLALALGMAMFQWTKGGLTLQGVASGAVGSGAINTVSTRLVLIPQVPLVYLGLVGAGFNGPLAPSLATAVTLGITKTFTTSGQYAGAVAGVGVGADVSRVLVADRANLTALLLPSLAGILGSGPLSPQLAQGLGTGISNLVKTMTGFGSVVGTPGPAPSTGTSTSVVV